MIFGGAIEKDQASVVKELQVSMFRSMPSFDSKQSTPVCYIDTSSEMYKVTASP